MLGSTPLTAVLGAQPDPTNHDAMRLYIKSLCDLGLSVLLCYPGTKRPFDGRTARKKITDDKAAQAEAKEAGRRNWQNAVSPSGLALATSDSGPILRKKTGYLDQYIAAFGEDVAVNIAIEVGGSRLIVVDCDTREQVENFLEVAGAPEDMPPTVLSPGAQDAEGNWVHSDGGHFYFTLPEGVELPENLGAITWGGEHGFAILWHRRYVLIPPSVRPEGQYELAGQDYEAPEWLVDAIIERTAARTSRIHDNNVGATDDLGKAIDEWAEEVSWADILEPLGWSMAARPDNCGCDVWTAPGDHSSPKSATAHDGGCGLHRYTETNAPLHIWTDNPGEPFDQNVDAEGNLIKTLSKLQAVAWANYGGSVGKAMDALGLGGGVTELERDLGLDNRKIVDADSTHDPMADIVLPPQEKLELHEHVLAPDGVHCVGCGIELTVSQGPDSEPAAKPFDIGEDDDAPDPDIFETGINGLPIIAPFSHWRDMPPPEYVVEGLVEHGGLSCVIGKSGIGKSSVVLDMALCIATGRPWMGRKTMQTRVLYMPGEGLSGNIQRIKAWAYMHDVPHEVIDQGIRVANDTIRVGASSEAWGKLVEYMIRQHIGLIIFDTYARFNTGIDENSATEVGKAIVRLDNVRKLTGAGAMLIHHTAKHDPKQGRGSSALIGALDTELWVGEGAWEVTEEVTGRPMQLEVTKQKNAEIPEDPIPLLMHNCEQYEAPYITGPTGHVDPMLGEAVLARPRPEPIVETAIRIKEFLAQFTEVHPTKAEIAAGVMPDPYTRSRTDSAKAWKQTIHLALDAGIHYDLIDYQIDSTTRFVAGPATNEQARTAHAARVMNEGDD